MKYKTILRWSAKVQHVKGIPFFYLLKPLKQYEFLKKGNSIESELAMLNGKVCLITRLE